MIDQFASQSVVAWYNHLLAREQWARDALAPYAGRAARIDTGLVSLHLLITAEGTLAVAGADTAELPSVTLSLEPQAIAGSLFDPAAFLNPAVAMEKLRAQVRIQGDAAFAQTLTDVLARLRPEPAEDLARFLGDAPAERIVAAFRTVLAQMREAAQRLARQGADFVVAENPLVVGRQEFERFTRDVADLRAALERLEQRTGAMAGKAPGPA